ETGTRSCWPRSRSSPPRSRSSRSRSATWRAPRWPRSPSRSARGRRARRRCRTSGTRSWPSGSAGSPGSCARTRRSGSRTWRSGTSATSRTPQPSAWSSRTRSSPSTTCSSGSPGWSKGSTSGRSGCGATSSPVTGSSSASGCCSRSSSPDSPAATPTGSSSGTRCERTRRSRTSASWYARTRRSRAGSTSTRSSTSAGTHVTSTPSSSGWASSPERRTRFMPEAATHVGSGKVRELYELDDDRLLLVASDRISTFDVVLPTEIPDKGRVLTGLSAFWFARTRHLVPNHLVALRGDGRSLECRRLEMLPVEVVVRGYLAGSGWTDYLATGEVGGTRLPSGLRESDRLPEPIVTPATKATEGHDVNITERDAEDLCGRARYRAAREAALAVYRFAARHAEQRGILLADTKFEFG